jgi:hypothetical protein
MVFGGTGLEPTELVGPPPPSLPASTTRSLADQGVVSEYGFDGHKLDPTDRETDEQKQQRRGEEKDKNTKSKGGKHYKGDGKCRVKNV